MKRKIVDLILIGLFLVSFPLIGRAQFVEEPAVTPPANAPAIVNADRVANIFDVLILVCALILVIGLFGFVIGFIRLVTAGGNENTIIASKRMLVTSGWLFGASIIGYLTINLVKYFIY
jgi:hypothetical protein